jgi:chromate transport protein ChrA
MIADVLFVLPGVIAIMALSWTYVIFGDAASLLHSSSG